MVKSDCWMSSSDCYVAPADRPPGFVSDYPIFEGAVLCLAAVEDLTRATGRPPTMSELTDRTGVGAHTMRRHIYALAWNHRLDLPAAADILLSTSSLRDPEKRTTRRQELLGRLAHPPVHCSACDDQIDDVQPAIRVEAWHRSVISIRFVGDEHTRDQVICEPCHQQAENRLLDDHD